MNKYTIYCTEEQTRKALELGAPIVITPMLNILRNEMGKAGYILDSSMYWFPTTEQMIGWLEEKGLQIDADWSWAGQITTYVWDKAEHKHVYTSNANSRQEATLAVIDAALDYLIENKK